MDHKCRFQRRDGLAAIHDGRYKLKPTVDVKNLLSVLEAEQPIPGGLVKKGVPQLFRPVICVKPGRNDYSPSTIRFGDRMGHFNEELVGIGLPTSLPNKSMRALGETD